MAFLGHDGNINFQQQAYWFDQIAGVSITTTAKIKLGGTQIFGTGADYLLPTATRCIVAVRPKMWNTTPTSGQFVLATLKVESADLHMGDFEVFASPIDGSPATTANQFQDKAPWWPLMQPCNGGEKMQFYGTAQVTNSAVVAMEADVLLSNTWPEGYSPNGWARGYGPVQAKVAGINYGGGPTSTGTAAAAPQTDAGVTISAPKKRLLCMVGVVLAATPSASHPMAGQFTVNASELTVNPQRFNAEVITGDLGTVVCGNLAHLSIAGPMNLGFTTNPSTLHASFALDQAIGAAGQFEMGYLYIDNP